MDVQTPATSDISTDIGVRDALIPMTSSAISKANANMEQHTLKAMLERPVIVGVVPWKSTASALPMNLTKADYKAGVKRELYRVELPQAILEKSQVIREKLNHFMLFKSDIKIDVLVNANKFQQGMLMVVYIPKAAAMSEFRNRGCETLVSLSSYPNRQMSIEKSNHMDFRVPYANTKDYIELTNPDDTFGELRIYVLTPLRGPSSAEEVTVTVKLTFEKVEVYGATQNSLNSQQKYRDLALAALNPPNYARNLGLRAQMMEGEKSGPVTKIANTIATVGDALSGIPFISEAASMVSWFARGVAGVATVFGWSKPIDLVMPIKTYNDTGAYMGNCEGKDGSKMLAQIPDNAIDCSEIVPSQMDEMALRSIWNRPNIVARVNVPKEDFVREQLLFAWEVSPFNLFTQQLQSDGQDFCLGSFSFASLMFRQWRGGIGYSLTCAKTQFHTGRMVAVYFPNSTREQLPPRLGELVTTNSNVILDLAADQGSEMDLSRSLLSVFTSATPWKRTLWKDAQGKYRSNTLNTCNGCIGVYCLTDLVCPEQVAQEVTFLIHVQAHKDYEVSIPSMRLQAGWAPLVDSNPQARLVALLNTQYGIGTQLECTGAIGVTPEIFQIFPDPYTRDVVIRQNNVESVSSWLSLDGEEFFVPNGDYEADIYLTFSPGALFLSGVFTFNMTVRDGQIDNVTANKFPLLQAVTAETFTIVATVPTFLATNLVGQMNEGAVLPIPQDAWLVQPTYHTDLTKSTTGEYCLSFRSLLKTFVHTRYLAGDKPTSLTPLDFQSYTSAVPTDPNEGVRCYKDAAGVQYLLPESWASMISYLYVFSAGSFRTKILMPWSNVSTTSLCSTESLATEYDQPTFAPEFVQAGVVNCLVETAVPFYSSVRANVIGGQPDGLFAKQTVAFQSPAVMKYYEAGGDDLSYFFLKGVPIFRPIDVLPTSPPLVPPAPTRRINPRSRVTRDHNTPSVLKPHNGAGIDEVG